MHDLLIERQRSMVQPKAPTAKDLIADVKMPRSHNQQNNNGSNGSRDWNNSKAVTGNGLPEDFEEEEKILQNRRIPAPHFTAEYDSLEEETKDYIGEGVGVNQNHFETSITPHNEISNDVLGEAFSDQ